MGDHGRSAILPLLVCLAGPVAEPARGESVREEHQSACRSYGELLARVAADREQERVTSTLDAESVIRTEMSDAPARALEEMLKLVGRVFRERWTPTQARTYVKRACPGWLSEASNAR